MSQSCCSSMKTKMLLAPLQDESSQLWAVPLQRNFELFLNQQLPEVTHLKQTVSLFGSTNTARGCLCVCLCVCVCVCVCVCLCVCVFGLVVKFTQSEWTRHRVSLCMLLGFCLSVCLSVCERERPGKDSGGDLSHFSVTCYWLFSTRLWYRALFWRLRSITRQYSMIAPPLCSWTS